LEEGRDGCNVFEAGARIHCSEKIFLGALEK